MIIVKLNMALPSDNTWPANEFFDLEHLDGGRQKLKRSDGLHFTRDEKY